jgi:hypothetical protein
VLSNQSKITRAFLYDPTMSLGTGPSPVPYTQGVRGVSVVTNPRMLIVSSLTDPLPTLNSTHFSNLWVTATGTLPTGWSTLATNWTGDITDLKIERIDLRPHFCRLRLNNLDPSSAGKYSIDSTNLTATVAAGTVTNGWYFVGTAVLLYQSDGTLQVTEILTEDTSYVYEQGRWGRYLVNGKAKASTSFGSLIDQFLAAPEPPNNANMFGSNKQAIVDEMYYYMWEYANWANDGFTVGGSSTTTLAPYYRFITDSADRLNDFSANLLKK